MLWNRNLLVRLLVPYLITLAAVAAVVYAYADRVVEGLYVGTLGDAVLRQARLAGGVLPWDTRGEPLDRRCAEVAAEVGARVSVIAADGVILGDSAAPSAALENPAEQPEVQAALRDGQGQAVRLNSSGDRPLLYRAWRQENARGGPPRVVRLAVAMSTIDAARQRIRRATWGGLGVAAVAALWPALVLSRRLSQRVARLTDFSTAVAAGQTPPPLLAEGGDLISRLETNLLAMAGSLGAQLQSAREEQGKLEAVLRGMVEGVLVIDRSGTVRLSNQRADQLLGSADSLVGRLLINISRDPDLQALVHEVTGGDRGARPLREVTLQHGGHAEHLQVTATAIAEANGLPQLFILVFHDVTELKKLEATRRDFVANVSHELRTPLTAIRGYAETLRTGNVDAVQTRKFLGVIERHSERLSRLTDDLLTLSDLELGRAALHRITMTLATAVDAAIDVVRDKAEQRQLQIDWTPETELPPLYADPDRIEQVLVNLLDNAVKYTPPAGRVTIGARQMALPEGAPAEVAHDVSWIEISVTDTGIGVPKLDLPRLTERFYRVDKARSRELGGTGLGLAIVKHIVQAHGGWLRIDSEVGRGTRVSIYLPAALPETAGTRNGGNSETI